MVAWGEVARTSRRTSPRPTSGGPIWSTRWSRSSELDRRRRPVRVSWRSAASCSIRTTPRAQLDARRAADRSSAAADGRAWLTRIGTEFRRRRRTTLPPSPPAAPREVTFADGGLTGPQWEAAVAEAVARIGPASWTRSCWPATCSPVAENDIDPRWLVGRLAGDTTRCWTYLIDGLVGATPEMLVRREAGLATSRVLAGTIRRSGDDDHDLSLGGGAGPVQQGPGGARVRGRLGRAALAPFCSGMNVPGRAVRAGAAQRLAPGHRRHRGRRPGRSLARARGRPASERRRLRHADRRRPRADRRAGAAGPGALRRTGRLDRRPAATASGPSRCAAASSTRPTRGRSGCSPAAASSPAPIPRPSWPSPHAKLIPMRDALGG